MSKASKKIVSLLSLTFMVVVCGQKVDFELYTLDNGMDVILHQDNAAPVVTVGVMYHVGAKDEDPDKTGFAHFFEHLLFEGTKNINKERKKGTWFEIVTSNGGSNNANTTQDRTYYYENFPSNNLELGLWMESERLLHPIIDQSGVDTQKEVVQEERRQRYDNSPYGRWAEQMFKSMFQNHPYQWTTIGSLEHLSTATLDDFKKFNEIYYVPNNATLVVAGDFKTNETKKLINAYFGSIPRGKEIQRKTYTEPPLNKVVNSTFYDPNIQIPLILLGYKTPAQTERDSYALEMVSTYLSDGQSSVLYKKLVDEQQKALQVFAFNYSLEDHGMYLVGGLPSGDNTIEDIQKEIDTEIEKFKSELISEKSYQKLLNKLENEFVNSNTSMQGIASTLATYHVLHNDINLINNRLDIFRSISREELQQVAKKYLTPNARVILHYLPESQKDKK